MRIFARQDGTLIASRYPINPGAPSTNLGPSITETPTATLDFDSETNTALAEGIDFEPHRYRLLAGVLTRDGVTVTPNPPGRYVQDEARLAAFLAKLDDDTSLTAAELRQALRFVLGWIVRRG